MAVPSPQMDPNMNHGLRINAAPEDTGGIIDPNTPMDDDPTRSDHQFIKEGEEMIRDTKAFQASHFAEAAKLVYGGIKPLAPSVTMDRRYIPHEVIAAQNAYREGVRQTEMNRIWLNKAALAADLRAERSPWTWFGNTAQEVRDLAVYLRHLRDLLETQPHDLIPTSSNEASNMWIAKDGVGFWAERVLVAHTETVQNLRRISPPAEIHPILQQEWNEDQLAHFPSHLLSEQERINRNVERQVRRERIPELRGRGPGGSHISLQGNRGH